MVSPLDDKWQSLVLCLRVTAIFTIDEFHVTMKNKAKNKMYNNFIIGSELYKKSVT